MTTATATALVDAFATASGDGVWPGLDRATLAAQLKIRLGAPNSVHQRQTPFCGPASFTRAVIIDMPDTYAQAAIDLFNTGEATIGSLKVKPGDKVRKSGPQHGTNQADWIMLASIRDSGNSVLSAGGIFGGNLAGITIPGTLADWFSKAGFGTVVNSADVTQTVPAARAAQVLTANTYRASGHHVVLFIDADVMEKDNQEDEISLYPDHWVTLTGEIYHGGTLAYEEPITMPVFSWGRITSIPEDPAQHPLKKKYFLNKFYGYIAVKK
jgi:hypothetical protein